MRYRRLTTAGDMSFGQGGGDFWVDSPEGVAQAVRTRLALQVGEWFLDTGEGTDYATQVLGMRTQDTRDQVLQERALGTTGVLSLQSYYSAFDPTTRAFVVEMTLETLYGSATVRETI